MSKGVFQPVGQKRLTNIAVVRLKKSGHRFEIACYKNKVADWRSGIEKDLDEVLQTTAVFENVSKGIFANEKALQEAFGTTDQLKICLEILGKGELQVSDKERKLEYDHLFKDVAGILSEKCVNPENNRPYTLTMLERALRDVHFNPDPKRSAKQQALEALPLLQQHFPIQRARMQLKLSVPSDRKEELLSLLDTHDAKVDSTEQTASNVSVVVQVEPGVFRELNAAMQGLKGRLEVLTFAVTADGAATELSMAAAAAASAAGPAGLRPPLAGASTPAPSAQQDAADVADAAAAAAAVAASTTRREAGPMVGEVVYVRGSIARLPEAHASRRERFSELDTLQPGWQVELRTKGDTVEAVFYSPSGQLVGSYAAARRMALQASKQQQSTAV